ncbi:hypothetical protein QFZ65_002801 [Arthrobacter sp. B3I9]|uniref:hypothetical protein n=1 Tax=Arthrobacter sp. B3I9 TaxID=3042270 RepID=UPI00279472B0|nr:hypothetical protein [Arthrobacter sp. B3I9]MDQ0850863.1 hypothetical protein [Arthrobacter sp. B3I9]
MLSKRELAFIAIHKDNYPLGGPPWGLYRFQTLEEATAFTQTQSYKDLKAVITSLTVTKLN